jgi:hypothetical protein
VAVDRGERWVRGLRGEEDMSRPTTFTFPDTTVVMLRHVIAVGPMTQPDNWWWFVIETTGKPFAWPAEASYKKLNPTLDAAFIREQLILALKGQG